MLLPLAVFHPIAAVLPAFSSWIVDPWSNLFCQAGLSAQTAAHIHGPAALNASAGVLQTLPVGTACA
jgi:hypothetical protein